jgi:hypothetical protein
VNVAGAFADGVEQEHVHQPHDGSVGAGTLELHGVHLFFVGAEVDVIVPEIEVGHHLLVGGARAIVAFDSRLDRRLAGDHRLDIEAGQKFDVVDGVQVRRIAHSDDQGRPGARNRDDAMLLAHVARHELHHFRVDLVLVQVDGGQPVLGREEARDLAVGDVAELGQRVAEVRARLLLLLLSLAQLLQADQLFPNEELTQSILRHLLPWNAGFGSPLSRGTANSTRRLGPRKAGPLTKPQFGQILLSAIPTSEKSGMPF